MVAVAAAPREEFQRAFTVQVSPCGHVEAKARGVPVAVSNIEAQAADMEAQIVIALSRYRYVSEFGGGRKATIRLLHLDGTLGTVLWRYRQLSGEEPRVWAARVGDLGALREHLRFELTMVTAGCPLMLERVDVELVAVDDAGRRPGAFNPAVAPKAGISISTWLL